MHSAVVVMPFLILAFSSLGLGGNTINIIILSGQSNMVGIGGVANGGEHYYDKWDKYIPPECQSNPSILRLSAEMKWEEAHEPLHNLYGSISGIGIGPGMPFANSLLKRDPAFGVIGLVPCAVSGTSIAQWSRNSSNYKRMLDRTRAAIDEGGVLRGLLWYQGESDSRELKTAEAYPARVVEFFNNVRADLQSPLLPIIQVAVASGFKYNRTVCQEQLRIELPNLRTVDATGLELLPPAKLHLSTAAQVKLGAMLADAFLRVLNYSN